VKNKEPIRYKKAQGERRARYKKGQHGGHKLKVVVAFLLHRRKFGCRGEKREKETKYERKKAGEFLFAQPIFMCSENIAAASAAAVEAPC
jgi:hypothetical protein